MKMLRAIQAKIMIRRRLFGSNLALWKTCEMEFSRFAFFIMLFQLRYCVDWPMQPMLGELTADQAAIVATAAKALRE